MDKLRDEISEILAYDTTLSVYRNDEVMKKIIQAVNDHIKQGAAAAAEEWFPFEAKTNTARILKHMGVIDEL